MARDIKASSSKWINEKDWLTSKFSWQQGAFFYSKSQIDRVAKYILNQPYHHRKTSFKDEYLDILNKLNIQFEEQYLFEWYH